MARGVLLENVRRHRVERVADRAQQQAVGERVAGVAAREVRGGADDVPGPDHAEAARVAHAVVRVQRREEAVDHGGALEVDREHVLAFEDVQRGQRRAARERVAGVRVRVQEAARRVVVVEGLVDRVGGEHRRQRQRAAGQALGQADEVRPDARLLVREHRAGAAEAHRDLVDDQVHAEAVAQRARLAQVGRVVHRHARRALHQRLDDEGGGLLVMLDQPRLQLARGAMRDVGGGLVALRATRVGRRDGGRETHQRCVGLAEQRDVGHAQRTRGLAVVAALQRDEAVLGRPAGVAPVVRAHLQRDLGGRGAVAGVERVAQAGEGGQALRQLDHGRMRQPGQHRVVEARELVDQRRADRRMAVAEEVGPPRADAVEVAPALDVDQPGPLGRGDRDQRRRIGLRAVRGAVRLHLRAGVPDGAQAAFAPGRVRAGEGGGHARTAGGRPAAREGRSIVRERHGKPGACRERRRDFARLLLLDGLRTVAQGLSRRWPGGG